MENMLSLLLGLCVWRPMVLRSRCLELLVLVSNLMLISIIFAGLEPLALLAVEKTIVWSWLLPLD